MFLTCKVENNFRSFYFRTKIKLPACPLQRGQWVKSPLKLKIKTFLKFRNFGRIFEIVMFFLLSYVLISCVNIILNLPRPPPPPKNIKNYFLIQDNPEIDFPDLLEKIYFWFKFKLDSNFNGLSKKYQNSLKLSETFFCFNFL